MITILTTRNHWLHISVRPVQQGRCCAGPPLGSTPVGPHLSKNWEHIMKMNVLILYIYIYLGKL